MPPVPLPPLVPDSGPLFSLAGAGELKLLDAFELLVTDVGLPPVIERSMALVAQASLPLALLCIGAALAGTPLRGNRRLVAASSLLKVVVGPLVGYALARLAGLDLAATQIALILLATPSAAAGYTMVSQLGGDEALAAGAILVTTAASAAALAVVVAATAG